MTENTSKVIIMLFIIGLVCVWGLYYDLEGRLDMRDYEAEVTGYDRAQEIIMAKQANDIMLMRNDRFGTKGDSFFSVPSPIGAYPINQDYRITHTVVLDHTSDMIVRFVLPKGNVVTLPVKLLADNLEFQSLLLLLEQKVNDK